MAFPAGLLNHGPATAHPTATLRPRSLGTPEPCAGTRGVAPAPGGVTSPRCHSVGLLLLLSLQPRADLACCFLPSGKAWLPQQAAGAFWVLWAEQHPNSLGMGWRRAAGSILVPLLLLLLLAVIVAINIITMYFYKRSGMSHAARGGGDVGSGQGTSRAGVLCSEVRNTGLAITGFSPGCSAGPERGNDGCRRALQQGFEGEHRWDQGSGVRGWFWGSQASTPLSGR